MVDSVLEELGNIKPSEINTGPLYNLIKPAASTKFGPEEPFNLFDSQWAKNAFFVGGEEYATGSDPLFNLYRSTADFTWEDTTPGGNVAVNPRHQYTRYSDPRRKGILPGRSAQSVSHVDNNLGMGRLYHEYLQDASEITFIRVGIIQNTSLLSFLNSYGNPELTRIHIQGQHSIKYAGTVGYFVGFGAAAAFTAWLSSPMKALLMAGASMTVQAVKAGLLDSTTDFYVLKPMMHLYWLAINSFVNTMLMEEGFIPPAPGAKKDVKGKRPADGDALISLGKIYPELFTVSKGIDVCAVMARSNLRWQGAMKKTAELMKSSTGPAAKTALGEHTIKEMILGSDPASAVPKDGLNDVLVNLWNKLPSSSPKVPHAPGTGTNTSVNSQHQQQRIDKTTVKQIKDSVEKSAYEKVKEGDTTFLQHGQNEFTMGAAFAVFRFDTASGLSDSFSNSVAPSNLAGVLNSASAGTRAITSEFGGVRNDKNAILDHIKGVANFIGEGIEGIGTGINQYFLSAPSAVSAIFEGSNAIIPDHWDASDHQIATVTYTTTLITTSQHPIARTMDLMLPLSMMIGLVSSRQVGPQAYTGPFMVSAFTRGKSNIKMGIAERMVIDREVTNQSYDKYGRPMAFKVSLTIKDLTPIAAMLMPSPVAVSQAEELKMTDGDSVFNRWVRTLAGRGIEEDFFLFDRARNRMANAYNIAGGRLSKARLAGALHDSLSGLPGYAWTNAVQLNIDNRGPGVFNRN